MNPVSTEAIGLSLLEKKKLLAQFLKPGSSEETSNLTLEQRRLCVLRRLGPTASSNVRGVFELSGKLDVTLFRKCISAVIARHEILRSKVVDLEGRPLRIAAPAQEVEIPTLDLRESRKEEQQREVQRLLATRMREPVNISSGLPVRLFLIQTEVAKHLLLIAIDEIAADQKSVDMVARQATDRYNSGTQAALPAAQAQYGDFALREREWWQSEGFVEDLEYWKQTLADAAPLDMPLDHARPTTKTHNAAVHTTTIPAGSVRNLEALGKREGTGLFVTLLAAFQLLLARYSGQEDILVGTLTDVRTSFGCENMAGQLSNQLVLRTRVSRRLSFRDLLARVKRTVAEAQTHQKMPFEKLVECLQPERDLSRTPLFQVMFLLEENDQLEGRPEGLLIKAVETVLPEAKFDLTLSLARKPEGLLARMEYNVDLFDLETIERMLDHLQNLLAEAAA